MKHSISRFLLAIAVSAVTPAIVRSGDAPPPAAAAAPVKITDKTHPDFVRCKTESIIGTRARVKRVCLTNRQWAEASQSGNQLARDIVTNAAAGGMNQQ